MADEGPKKKEGGCASSLPLGRPIVCPVKGAFSAVQYWTICALLPIDEELTLTLPFTFLTVELTVDAMAELLSCWFCTGMYAAFVSMLNELPTAWLASETSLP